MPNGNILLEGKGVANAIITLRASFFLGPPIFPFLAQTMVDPSGHWQFEDEDVSGVRTRFYQATYP
jgi:hypothetical protein